MATINSGPNLLHGLISKATHADIHITHACSYIARACVTFNQSDPMLISFWRQLLNAAYVLIRFNDWHSTVGFFSVAIKGVRCLSI